MNIAYRYLKTVYQFVTYYLLLMT